MTIPRNDQIKYAIVDKLKANTTVTNELLDSDGVFNNEIREAFWQGSNFFFPGVRVRVIENRPSKDNCDYSNTRIGIMVFSEQDSSQQADRISGIIANELHTKSFESQGIKFPLLVVENIVPAIRSEEGLWMSEVILSGRVNG